MRRHIGWLTGMSQYAGATGHRVVEKKGEKGEGRRVAQGSGQQPPKPKSMPKSLERMVVLVPDLAALEPPTWYNDAWWAICRRGMAVEDLDVSKYVTELSDSDMVKYQSSFDKLVRPVQEIAEVNPKPSKLLGVIDLRGQIGGKALIYETAVTEGVLYLATSHVCSECDQFRAIPQGQGNHPCAPFGGKSKTLGS